LLNFMEPVPAPSELELPPLARVLTLSVPAVKATEPVNVLFPVSVIIAAVDAGDTVRPRLPPVSLIFPLTVRALLATAENVRLPLRIMSRATVWVGVPVVPVVAIFPPKVIRLPPRVNDPPVLVLSKLMVVKIESAAKLLLVVVWVVPVNVNESLGGAGNAFQLPAVFQLLSPPPPLQVLVAA